MFVGDVALARDDSFSRELAFRRRMLENFGLLHVQEIEGATTLKNLGSSTKCSASLQGAPHGVHPFQLSSRNCTSVFSAMKVEAKPAAHEGSELSLTEISRIIYYEIFFFALAQFCIRRFLIE